MKPMPITTRILRKVGAKGRSERSPELEEAEWEFECGALMTVESKKNGNPKSGKQHDMRWSRFFERVNPKAPSQRLKI